MAFLAWAAMVLGAMLIFSGLRAIRRSRFLHYAIEEPVPTVYRGRQQMGLSHRFQTII